MHQNRSYAGALGTSRRSETDQEGAGRQIGVLYGSDPGTCPVRAYRTWLAAGFGRWPAVPTGEPLWPPRHGRLGARSALWSPRHEHSQEGSITPWWPGMLCAAGWPLALASAGATEVEIMTMTGHRSRLLSGDASGGVGSSPTTPHPGWAYIRGGEGVPCGTSPPEASVASRIRFDAVFGRWSHLLTVKRPSREA